MRLLLDTHAVIWALETSPKLSAKARKAIEDPGNEVLVSAASALEIAIKTSMGKLRAPSNDLLKAVTDAGFLTAPIGFPEAAVLESLPWHHADPFDRLLVAQAMVQGIPIVTRDPEIARYQVQVVW
jgi:PIN domain nuclease of toxin-antitoxin system